MESAEPAALEQQTFRRPLTKSGIPSNQTQTLSDAEVLHFFQTDHRSILIQHIEFHDSIYVQTLTEKDVDNFCITEEELAFSDAYIVKLNELHKQH